MPSLIQDCLHPEFSLFTKTPKLHQSNPSSFGSSDDSCLYLSTNIPACTACTMVLNRGFSSLLLSIIPICRVKVEASQSRTSEGTASDWMSLSSSSVSRSRLNTRNTPRTLRWDLKFELSVPTVALPLKETKLNWPQKQPLFGKACDSSSLVFQV